MLYTNGMPPEWEGRINTLVGKNIKRLRTQSGWSVNELYARTGIQRITINRWELGIRSPKICTLLWLCKCTGWKLADIIGGKRHE